LVVYIVITDLIKIQLDLKNILKMCIKKLFGKRKNLLKDICILTPLPVKFFSDVKNLKKGFLYSTGDIKNISIVFSKMGQTFIGDAVMYLKNTKINKFIFIGLCGSVYKNLKIGEITVPSKTFSFESYTDILEKKLNKKIYKPNFDFKKHIGIKNFKKSTNITFSSFYFEKKYLNFFKELKIDTVELELSSFFSSTKLAKKQNIGFLIISDYIENNFTDINKDFDKIKNSINKTINIIKNWA